MASKHRQRRLSNLKRSFVVTLSTAAAASLGGCDSYSYVPVNPPPSFGGYGGGGAGGTGGQAGTFAGTGGSGGSGGTGVGGHSGIGASGVGGASPDPTCPTEIPRWGEACARSSDPCMYQPPPECDGVVYPLVATCEDTVWAIDQTSIACNPPWEYDAGTEDEDAGG